MPYQLSGRFSALVVGVVKSRSGRARKGMRSRFRLGVKKDARI
jgi:hypothetical protein